MRISVFFLLAVLCFSGCATMAPPNADNLTGEWRFVYVQKAHTMFGQNPLPPSFDVLEFRIGGTIRLKDSVMHREFTGTYSLTGDKLSWVFTPPDLGKPVEHRLECSWGENGRSLVLRLAKGQNGDPMETEWVYYRPTRLLATNAIAGKWVVSHDGKSGDMTFGKDGQYFMEGRKIWGYYRLWSSRYGNVATSVIWVDGEGSFMLLNGYTIDGDKLSLIPLSQHGLEKGDKTVWTRAGEPAASGK